MPHRNGGDGTAEWCYKTTHKCVSYGTFLFSENKWHKPLVYKKYKKECSE